MARRSARVAPSVDEQECGYRVGYAGHASFRSPMLVSLSHNFAFVHYPKTAGTSVIDLLTSCIPDLHLIDPSDKHLDVQGGLKRLMLQNQPIRRRMAAFLGRPSGRCDVTLPAPLELRVLGILREPFEMTVSLFEHWGRALPDDEKHHSPLASAATKGDFQAFLRIMAFDDHTFPAYRTFYDFGGPLWAQTTLVDFAHLRSGLAEALAQLGIKADLDLLRHLNAGDRTPERMQSFEKQAGPLLGSIRKRFGWNQRPNLLKAPPNYV